MVPQTQCKWKNMKEIYQESSSSFTFAFEITLLSPGQLLGQRVGALNLKGTSLKGLLKTAGAQDTQAPPQAIKPECLSCWAGG